MAYCSGGLVVVVVNGGEGRRARFAQPGTGTGRGKALTPWDGVGEEGRDLSYQR